MPFIVWLKQDKSVGLKVNRGQVAFSWTGPPGLDGILRACPKKGALRDLIILCDEVVTLSVHLPIMLGKEPDDPTALRESLRWEAEPLLGFSPAGVPFAFTPGGTQEDNVDGSDWWVASLEPALFSAWSQACQEGHFQLRTVMDPWAALTSCLTAGNHLLVHNERVVLAAIDADKVKTFKTWRRPAGADPDSKEWIHDLRGSSEWAGFKEEVLLWDLCGSLDSEAVTRELSTQSGLTVRPAKLTANGNEPWCYLLATSTGKILRSKARLPAVPISAAGGRGLKFLEYGLYTALAAMVLLLLYVWYDTSADNGGTLETHISYLERTLNEKEEASQEVFDARRENEELRTRLAARDAKKRLVAWQRRLPFNLVQVLDGVNLPRTTFRNALGWSGEKTPEILLEGDSGDQREFIALVEHFQKAPLGMDGCNPVVNYAPVTTSGSFSIALSWPDTEPAVGTTAPERKTEGRSSWPK